MFARKGVFSSIGRAATLATVAAVALTAVEPTMALAGSANGKPASVTPSQGTSGATDFSSRGRYYRGGGAAAAAAFAGIVGTGLAIAAAQNRYYDSYGYYGGGPVYYDPGPTYYYGGPGYYGYNRANSYGYGGYGYNGHLNYYNGW
jgi:hypothetical protein